MDNDTQAIAIGLGAGLGGFAGLLLVGCICWHICCGSWCEKKNVQSTVVPLPVKKPRSATTATKIHTDISAITTMKGTNIYSDLKSVASNDLANKVKSARR